MKKNTSLMKIFFQFTFKISIVFHCIHRAQNVPIAGKYSGKEIKVLNKSIYAYLGIPYAAPPVGNLRFREPQPVEYENITYNAIKKSASCVQDPTFSLIEWNDRDPKDISEDCLYLNVWVPSTSDDGKPFATMVWIYAGGFIMGSTSMNVYDGAAIASIGNIIVVTFNYRISALGFSNFGTREAAGNMGMLDQVMALKWVHQNINLFGGDKNLVTVFGDSVGSVSIAHHLISPMTKGLFSRAILQSGSNYHEYFAVNPSFNIKRSEELANELGCSGKDALNCMKNKNPFDIISAEKKLTKLRPAIMYFHPQVGPPLLSDDPYYDIDSGTFHEVDILIGDVKDEGSIFIPFFNPEVALENAPVFPKTAARTTIRKTVEISDEYANIVANEYLGNISEEDYSEILKQTIKASGDGLVTCSVFHLTEKLSEYNRKVYHYRFNHTRAKLSLPKWIGVPHFEDVYFVFGRPLLKLDEFTPEEAEFSRNVIQLWTSFAKTGKPTYDGLKQEWMPFDKINRNSLSITLGNIRPVVAEINEKCDVWKNVMRSYTRKMYMN